MGMLVDGIWHDVWYDTKGTGQFVRAASQFRNFVTSDGSPGPTGKGGFKAESGRYHLYVSYACPWAHRTLIFRKLKGLEDHVAISVVNPLMLEKGWIFRPEDTGATADHLFGATALSDIYLKSDPHYTGRVTVPVLWDRKSREIVSNESAEIIRMFNSEFDHITGNDEDFYPEDLRAEIDELNAYVYDTINNGVYRCGFATTQRAYEENFDKLFAALDTIEARLEGKRYLFGDRLTEADVRLFTTLARFDAVYVGHFKTNKRRIADYPNLSGYLHDLYTVPRIGETVNFDHIKRHYYGSHKTINPNGIVPLGPELNFV